MYTTPYALPLSKEFVSNFDFGDRNLVNITSKLYLLAKHLDCFDIPFSYGIKSFGVSLFWLVFDLLLDGNVRLIVYVTNLSG